MKLVASSKLKSVEEALNKGKAFGESLLSAVALKEDKFAERKKDDEDAAMNIFVDDKKHLILALTTDRGLCGSVNSSLTRTLRKELNAVNAAGKQDVKLFICGEKGRAQVARDYVPMMARSLDGYMDRDPIFALASAIASKVITEKYDVLTLWYNR
jgi:F-type H+-transporting ATPase subunit gamma